MLMIKARISISQDWFRKSEKHDTGAIGIPRWINPMKHQSGFTLIEALIALVLVSIVAVVFLMALATATKATAQANIHTMAESLAYGRMEAIKAAPYLTAVNSGSDSAVASYAFTLPPDSNYVFCTLNNTTPQTAATNKIYGMRRCVLCGFNSS
jgi:prepilin-type N-terminal cleavage/methylation domain-containing protein